MYLENDRFQSSSNIFYIEFRKKNINVLLKWWVPLNKGTSTFWTIWINAPNNWMTGTRSKPKTNYSINNQDDINVSQVNSGTELSDSTNIFKTELLHNSIRKVGHISWANLVSASIGLTTLPTKSLLACSIPFSWELNIDFVEKIYLWSYGDPWLVLQSCWFREFLSHELLLQNKQTF